MLPRLASGNTDPCAQAMRFAAKRATWEMWIFAPTAAGLAAALERHALVMPTTIEGSP